MKYIPDAMQEYLLTSMHLTQMEIRGLPAVLEIFRRLEMVKSLGGKTTAADDFGAVVDDDFLA